MEALSRFLVVALAVTVAGAPGTDAATGLERSLDDQLPPVETSVTVNVVLAGIPLDPDSWPLETWDKDLWLTPSRELPVHVEIRPIEAPPAFEQELVSFLKENTETVCFAENACPQAVNATEAERWLWENADRFLGDTVKRNATIYYLDLDDLPEHTWTHPTQHPVTDERADLLAPSKLWVGKTTRSTIVDFAAGHSPVYEDALDRPWQPGNGGPEGLADITSRILDHVFFPDGSETPRWGPATIDIQFLLPPERGFEAWTDDVVQARFVAQQFANLNPTSNLTFQVREPIVDQELWERAQEGAVRQEDGTTVLALPALESVLNETDLPRQAGQAANRIRILVIGFDQPVAVHRDFAYAGIATPVPGYDSRVSFIPFDAQLRSGHSRTNASDPPNAEAERYWHGQRTSMTNLVIHEAAHIFGLAHPHDGGSGTWWLADANPSPMGYVISPDVRPLPFSVWDYSSYGRNLLADRTLDLYGGMLGLPDRLSERGLTLRDLPAEDRMRFNVTVNEAWFAQSLVRDDLPLHGLDAARLSDYVNLLEAAQQDLEDLRSSVDQAPVAEVPGHRWSPDLQGDPERIAWGIPANGSQVVYDVTWWIDGIGRVAEGSRTLEVVDRDDDSLILREELNVTARPGGLGARDERTERLVGIHLPSLRTASMVDLDGGSPEPRGVEPGRAFVPPAPGFRLLWQPGAGHEGPRDRPLFQIAHRMDGGGLQVLEDDEPRDSDFVFTRAVYHPAELGILPAERTHSRLGDLQVNETIRTAETNIDRTVQVPQLPTPYTPTPPGEADDGGSTERAGGDDAPSPGASVLVGILLVLAVALSWRENGA